MSAHYIFKTLVYMTSVMIIQNDCYVLLAANLDDFRSIAKKFVPGPLADQLANLAGKSGFQYKQVEESSIDSTYSDDQDNRDARAKDVRFAKVNFNDLVDKVKAQIDKDLNAQKKIKTIDHRPKPQYSEEEVIETKKVSRFVNNRISRTTRNVRKQKMVRQVQRPIPKPEQSDGMIFSKIEIGGKDSYEDYVTPKREDDIFESDNGDKKRNNQPTDRGIPEYANADLSFENFHDRTTRRDKPQFINTKEAVQKKQNIPSKEEVPVYMDTDDNIEKDEIPNSERETPEYENDEDHIEMLDDTPTTQRQMPGYQNEDDYEKLNENLKHEDEIKYANVDSENPNTYDDKPDELKAQTGNLWYDEKQTKATNDLDTTTIKSKVKNQKTTTVKKGTMIPKRDFYKMSSPNYAAKVPIVAEKYNFDEPIPEKDREPEKVITKGLKPVIINGKIRISK